MEYNKRSNSPQDSNYGGRQLDIEVSLRSTLIFCACAADNILKSTIPLINLLVLGIRALFPHLGCDQKYRRNMAEVKPMSALDRFRLKFSLADRGPSAQICVPPNEHRISLFYLFWRVLKDPFHVGFRDLVLWRISTSYMNFFLQSLVFFLVYVHIFAVLIYFVIQAGYAHHGAMCSSSIWYYEADWKTYLRHNMETAFELSWITFTTVGYGNVAPSTSTSGCYGLRYLCAFEAFIGLVYFSLLGAIFFSKIGLTFGEAPITFSRAVCIKYDASSTAFPVLEIQIVHNKANQLGHEILSASLLCMVAIDVLDSDRLVESEQEKMFSLDFNKTGRNDSRIAKQTYHEIKLVGGKHPYFNRVWQCQHILNEDSPLLKRSIREEIKITGVWPTNKLSHRIRLALVPFNTMVRSSNNLV